MPDSLTFEQKLLHAWPPSLWRDVTVVVAVSGGPDSVALLRGLAGAAGQGPGTLIAAHFNHALRGDQSQADEVFVVDLCRSLGVQCEVGRDAARSAGISRSDPPGNDSEEPHRQFAGGADEASLRAARYQFLDATARRVGARYVATGHTADDQAETVLHRLVRGTGLAGLAGMRPHRQLTPGLTLTRPLLNVSRREVLEYLAAIGQPYRVDRSNADLQFTRNRIRHELLPHLASAYNAGVVEALTRLATLAGEVQEIVAGLAEELAARCLVTDPGGGVAVDCDGLANARRYLVRELLITVWRQQGWPLQSMGFERWEELAEMALAPQPPAAGWKKDFPGAISIERAGRWLRLAGPALLAVPAEPAESSS